MTKKRSVFRKILSVLSIPLVAIWTIITGDGGNSALFINDISKKDDFLDESTIREMTN